jgi:hypothetical protein
VTAIRPAGTVRYPVAVVLDALGGRPLTTLEPSLRRAVYRARKSAGLNDRQADHVAVALGRHPAELWPELW